MRSVLPSLLPTRNSVALSTRSPPATVTAKRCARRMRGRSTSFNARVLSSVTGASQCASAQLDLERAVLAGGDVQIGFAWQEVHRLVVERLGADVVRAHRHRVA